MTSTDAKPPVVLVTGSSSGIGQATADMLAAKGWRVWGGSRRGTSEGTPGVPGWTPIVLDVTSEQSVGDAIARILERDGRIDALVHCAGMSVAGAVEDVTIAEAEHQFSTNYFGSLRVIRAVLPDMRRRRNGRILVIGSIGGLIGLPFIAHYSASKFALDGLIEALRHEVAPFAIQTTILHPGDIRTSISRNQVEGQNTGPASPYHARFRATVDLYNSSVEAARGPQAIAAIVAHTLARRRQPPRIVAGTLSERAGLVLKATLPRRSFEQIIARVFGLA